MNDVALSDIGPLVSLSFIQSDDSSIMTPLEEDPSIVQLPNGASHDGADEDAVATDNIAHDNFTEERAEVEVASRRKRKTLIAVGIAAMALLAVVIGLSVGLGKNHSGSSSIVLASANSAPALEDYIALVEDEVVVVGEEGEVEANEETTEEEDQADQLASEVPTTRIPTWMPTIPVPTYVPTNSPDGGTEDQSDQAFLEDARGEESESTNAAADDLNVVPIPQQREQGYSNDLNDVNFSKQQVNEVAANGRNSNDNGVDVFLVRRDLRGSSRVNKVGPSSKPRICTSTYLPTILLYDTI